eukprot:TRINITY_DN89417_c0_g1_i1.p1 TRINITY_DN89417_c0_g1~~TRINITY_DN89417_c0_g1_i1.p1  ORF type:complete len:365 (+),score=74.46 TRINITY_DN89417_c0_g1_i1:41-1135(+)
MATPLAAEMWRTAAVASTDLESEQESAEELGLAPHRGRGLLFRVTAMAAGLLGAAALAHRVSTASSSSSRYSSQSAHTAVSGDTLEMDEEGGFPGFPGMQTMEEEGSNLANSIKGELESHSTLDSAASGFSDLMHKAKKVLGNLPTVPPPSPLPPMSPPTDQQQPVPGLAASSSVSPKDDKVLEKIAPVGVDLHDSNPCGSDEEFFESLCYRKCSVLTNNQKPVRCASHICEPLNAAGEAKCSLSQAAVASILASPSILPCHGFDIAGAEEGRKRCPHPPGLCYKDEELYLGTCIKKCSTLTNGEFPRRIAFATCCKVPSLIRCLYPGNSKTDQAFAAGGGQGDNDPNTLASAHSPIKALAESN